MSVAKALPIPGLDPQAPVWVREHPHTVVARGRGYVLRVSIPRDQPRYRPHIAVTWRAPRGLRGPMPNGGRWYRCWREHRPYGSFLWMATVKGARIGGQGACADDLPTAKAAAEGALRVLLEERERTDPFFRSRSRPAAGGGPA